MGRAREAGLVDVSFHNPRDFSRDRHGHVDDSPYGGGPGMVLRGEPLAAALRSIPRPGRMLVMSPGGRPMTQRMARQWAGEEHLTLVCGRYEGLDQRLFSLFPLEAVSLGDMVLNGGEAAALYERLRTLSARAENIRVDTDNGLTVYYDLDGTERVLEIE